jgi:hypothetical protein
MFLDNGKIHTKLDPKEIGWDSVDWIHLVQVRDQ